MPPLLLWSFRSSWVASVLASVRTPTKASLRRGVQRIRPHQMSWTHQLSLSQAAFNELSRGFRLRRLGATGLSSSLFFSLLSLMFLSHDNRLLSDVYFWYCFCCTCRMLKEVYHNHFVGLGFLAVPIAEAVERLVIHVHILPAAAVPKVVGSLASCWNHCCYCCSCCCGSCCVHCIITCVVAVFLFCCCFAYCRLAVWMILLFSYADWLSSWWL